jgi:two-component sensor histidine kinase
MQHRMANLLALVQGISLQTARTSTSLDDFQAAYSARLVALGQAQRIILEAPGSAVALSRLLRTVFDPFSSDQIALDGPDVHVPEKLVPSLALIMHELATNAVKYGALVTPAGRVSVSWQLNGGGSIALQWQEQGGPPVRPPARAGFGSRLFRTAFADPDSVEVTYPLEGVVCRVNLPAR